MSLSRRPTSEELEELAEAFEREPGGEAASKLALAYLSLGRPRDALDVGAKALRFRPENIEARAFVGEAFAALHQWERAKDELLKVVKVDRRQRRAARLLGEVLMRRGDFDRAVPVLQHAYQLNPQDTEAGDLLERARAGRAPDPPPAIPSPVAPAASRQEPPGDVFGEEPTRQVDAGETAGILAGERAAGKGEAAGAGASPASAQGTGAATPGAAKEAGHPAGPPAAGAAAGGKAPAPAQGTLFGAAPIANPQAKAPPQGGGGAPAGAPLPGMPGVGTQASQSADPGGSREAPQPGAGQAVGGGSAAAPGIGETEAQPPGGVEAKGPGGAAAPSAGAPQAAAEGGAAGAPQAAAEGGAAGAPQAPPAGSQAKGADAQAGQQGAGEGAAKAARPRVFADDKPVEAAGAIKQAAAVGEQYLNNLLTGGLLSVPNVREPEVSLQVTPTLPKRRAWRLVGYLAVFGVLAAGVALGWEYYSERQRLADFERQVDDIASLLPSGAHADVAGAVTAAETALERAPEAPEAMAAFVEAGGVAHLLYGLVERDDVLMAHGRAERDVEDGTPAARSLALGRAAVAIAPPEDGAPAEEDYGLEDAQDDLQALLEADENDHMARWLLGEAHAAAGDWSRAEEALEAAYASGEGAGIAAVTLADRAQDAGDFDRADELYGALLPEDADALADDAEPPPVGELAVDDEDGAGEEDEEDEVDTHELALLGQVLTKAELSAEDPRDQASAALEILSVELRDRGPRVAGYRLVAEAMARFLLQDYGAAAEALGAAEEAGVRAPRLRARIGLGRIAMGHVEEAEAARRAIRWRGDDPEPHPLVEILDAELLLAQGRPAAAAELLEGRTDLRARRALARAHFDLGDYGAALDEIEAARAIAPTDARLETWELAATLATESGDEFDEAEDELRALARASRSRGPYYAQGAGLLAAGDERGARRALERSLDRLADDVPNPLEYKAHTALAALAAGEGDGAEALERLGEALAHNPTYLPAHERAGILRAEAGEFERAFDHLRAVVEEGVASAEGELAYARAAIATGEGDAAGALARAADKGADDEAVAAVAERAGRGDLLEEQ